MPGHACHRVHWCCMTGCTLWACASGCRARSHVWVHVLPLCQCSTAGSRWMQLHLANKSTKHCPFPTCHFISLTSATPHPAVSHRHPRPAVRPARGHTVQGLPICWQCTRHGHHAVAPSGGVQTTQGAPGPGRAAAGLHACHGTWWRPCGAGHGTWPGE